MPLSDKKKDYQRKYYKKNSEKLALVKRNWNKKNPEKVKKYREKYLSNPNNREKYNSAMREWKKKNRGKLAKKSKEYYEKNKDRAKEYSKRYHKKNRDRSRWRHIEKKYSITKEEYLKILLSQKGRCKICESEFKGISPYVDHCHKTNKMRGILCPACNTGIGLFKDSSEICIKAGIYLKVAEVKNAPNNL